MSTVSMTEQEFLSRIGHGQCVPDIMSEALAEFFRSRGFQDAARALVDWIGTREEMGAGADCCGEREACAARLGLECAARAFEQGEPDIAKGVINDFLSGANA